MGEPRYNLIAARTRAGIGIREAGAALGVAESTIYYWEQGRHSCAKTYEAGLMALYAACAAGQPPPEDVLARGQARASQRAVLRSLGRTVPRQKTLERARLGLAFIRGYIAENGFAPTQAEIGVALGAPSPASAGAHVVRLLEQTGFVTRGASGESRALALTEKGKEA